MVNETLIYMVSFYDFLYVIHVWSTRDYKAASYEKPKKLSSACLIYEKPFCSNLLDWRVSKWTFALGWSDFFVSDNISVAAHLRSLRSDDPLSKGHPRSI